MEIERSILESEDMLEVGMMGVVLQLVGMVCQFDTKSLLGRQIGTVCYLYNLWIIKCYMKYKFSSLKNLIWV